MMTAAARLTVLNAFINKGSWLRQLYSTLSTKWTRLTGIAYHAIPAADNFDRVCGLCRFAIVPGILVLCRYSSKVGIELGRLFVIVLEGLLAVGPQCIFIQRVDLNRCSDRVCASQVWSYLS